MTTSGELFSLLRDRLARDRRFNVYLPFGPMDWTILVLHAFWDSWLHERDVLLPRGADHPTDADATGYAAAYGVFLAAALASMFGHPVQQELTLGGDDGGVFNLDSHSDLVTLTVTPAGTAGPPAAQVTDALSGREPTSVVLADLPANARAALSILADFSNAPAELSPAAWAAQAFPLKFS